MTFYNRANEQNIEEDEKKGILNSTIFIFDFKKVAVFAGVLAYGYLVGKRSGVNSGYVKGYRRCIDDIGEIMTTNNKV